MEHLPAILVNRAIATGDAVITVRLQRFRFIFFVTRDGVSGRCGSSPVCGVAL